MHHQAIVTGGSSGLGLETARCLLHQGIDTCIVARDETRLERAERELRGVSTALVKKFSGSVGEESTVKALFEELSSVGWKPTLVFNIAGVGRFDDPDSIKAPDIQRVFEGNLIGLILMCTHAIRAMTGTGGTLVNIMSTAAFTPRAKESVYCAAKWGARGFSEAARVALKGSNIRILAVYPGGMQTGFWSDECGLNPDTSTFMLPAEVAVRVVEAAIRTDSSIVSDLTINRGERK